MIPGPPDIQKLRVVVAVLMMSLANGAIAVSDGPVLRSDGSEVVYYLRDVERLSPDKSVPLLLLVQGSDCSALGDPDAKSVYDGIAPELPMLLVEKYGLSPDVPGETEDTSCPSEYMINNSMSQRVLDLLLVLESLRKNLPLWDGSLVIVGGSLGATVAGQLATAYPGVRAMIIFSFGSRFFEDDLMPSIESEFAGLDADEREQQIGNVKRLFDEIRNEPTRAKFAGGHSYASWNEMLRTDQLAVLRQVDVPVLAIQGDADTNASPSGARQLIADLVAAGKNNFTYQEVADVDHGFVDSQGRSQFKSVIDDMRVWLTRTLSSHAGTAERKGASHRNQGE